EIAQGLALMGCRPQWDAAPGRVTGIEVLPPGALGRPRVDVTWRISGLFRDMFPTQIALIDAAANAVAGRDEDDTENPLAAATRAHGKIAPRIFGTSPGTYGAAVGVRGGLQIGPADLLAHAPFAARQQILDAGAIGAGVEDLLSR
ncbi:cobaltochelatase subunit CobN, partial [Mesorhizobium sp. M2A.F.Ca.ET.015.02.1.1]|uniref:cobaltochelatase subunit CobN n=1 Tax=Mesorhizobium sp. M2A.F.Ca.ET.015.02.1.1 TaxID=2496758 RepID=UPI000FD53EAE